MTIEIRNQLIEKGYNVRCVNMGCYDIDQNGRIHYLSAKEGDVLNNADIAHPVNLFDYAIPRRNVVRYFFQHGLPR